MKNYPPNVTGNEPEIIGTGLEDKCVICVENADDELTIDQISDGTHFVYGEWVCDDCGVEKMEEDIE